MMENCYSYLDENINVINDKIQNACNIAGRNTNEITLLAITKTIRQEIIESVLQKGIFEIGENKVQEMLEKHAHLSNIHHKTHIVGHLQKNKVKYLPTKVDMVQSVDSLKLAQALDAEYAKHNLNCQVLVQVNIGLESSKTGVLQQDAEQLCIDIMNLKNLELKGLMCIPPYCEGDKIRNYFEKMYKLFIDIRDEKMDNSSMSILSMGMSSDYDKAILEGSTMVRIGTSLFGQRY